MTNDETTCPECAETIKAAAKVCKHCGYRLTSDAVVINDRNPAQADTASDLSGSSLPPWQAWTAIGVIVVMLAIAATFSFKVMNFISNPPAPHSQTVGIDYMKKDLKDPSSAQFRKLYSNDRCLTGEINAKNSFGAYTGFKEFYYDDITKKGRVAPTTDINLEESLFYSQLKDSTAYKHEESVCMMGEKVTAESEAKAAKIIAAEKRR